MKHNPPIYCRPARHPKVRDGSLTDSEIVRHIRNGARLAREYRGERYILWNVVIGKRKSKPEWQTRSSLYYMPPWRARKAHYYISRDQVIRLVCAGKITKDHNDRLVVV